jgi:hypothetical protein
LTVVERLRRRINFLLLTNKSFRLFRAFGVHLMPVHYYSPIPDVRELRARPEIWEGPSQLLGIDMNTKAQLRLMEEVIAAHQHECDFARQPGSDPFEFYTQNGYFGYASAAAMHGIIRHYRPGRIIEVGAGHSTRVIARAADMNAASGSPVELMVVDPNLDEALLNSLRGRAELIPRKVEEVDPARLTSLQAGDLLSIDTSHAVRTGGDVVFLYLEVLPRLAPGVLVHVHDIFIPFDYPEVWLQRRFFWNEQYLLHAFLLHNDAYEVLWGQKYAESFFPEAYAKTFGRRTSYEENLDSYSFWLRRVRE